jgi:hypothetical protein
MNYKNYKLRLKLNRIFLTKLTGIVIFSVFIVISLWGWNVQNKLIAANITYYSYHEDGDPGVCQLSLGGQSASIPDSQESDFDAGIGVKVPGQTIYKSNKLDYCCFDFPDASGCEDLIIKPNANAKDPWFSTYQSTVYLKNMGSVSPGTPSAGYFSINPNEAKISEFTFSSENDAPGNTTNYSHNNQLLFGYSNPAVNPPALSNFENWFDYLKKLVEVNTGTDTFQTINQGLPTNTNNGNVFYNAGNHTVTSNTFCSVGAIIFVQGNLTLEPNVQITNPHISQEQACLFIVEGDVYIEPPSSGVPPINLDGNLYDLLELGIISSGKVEIKQNVTTGLKIEGMITARSINTQRDIDDENYPSFIVEYDPRYMEVFKDELKVLKYSTREKGFLRSYSF